jgi:exodeoxyribonuclease VII small subunit
MAAKKIKFEEALQRLEEISSLLADENVPLEEILKLYEEGIKLTKLCQTKLKEAELTIKKLDNELLED